MNQDKPDYVTASGPVLHNECIESIESILGMRLLGEVIKAGLGEWVLGPPGGGAKHYLYGLVPVVGRTGHVSEGRTSEKGKKSIQKVSGYPCLISFLRKN